MSSQKSFKLEIQGLRAVAVSAVLVFHIWPTILPGGYVGVDVFFVISGYLITGMLLRDAERSGSISLASFYTGRIRRLLPAATAIIVLSAACFALLPQVRWLDVAWDAVASGLYVQNWWLGIKAVDYLSEGNAPSLLQHYWSLSVEEQYYLIWPLIGWALLATSSWARRNPQSAFIFLTSIFGILSFAYSIYLTEVNSGLAYFASTTRAWELALGGILACSKMSTVNWPDWWRAALGWIGLGLIAWASLAFGATTPFPGYAALLPTVGTVLVVAAAQSTSPWSVYALLKQPVVQFLGDLSYSLYLVHWPIIVIFNAVTGSAPTSLPAGLFLLGLSLAAAVAVKRWIEDPLRYGAPILGTRVPSPRLLLGSSVAIVAITASLIVVPNRAWLGAGPAQVDARLLDQNFDPGRPTIPPLAIARNDNPDVYKLGCHVNQAESTPKSCEFGSAFVDRIVVLVGDSHAAQWLPAIQKIYGNRPGWRIATYTKSACTLNAQGVTIGTDRRHYTSCAAWNDNVLDELKTIKPEIVFISGSSTYRSLGSLTEEANFIALAEGYVDQWRQIIDIGSKMVVFHDTPRMKEDVPDCMSRAGTRPDDCATLRSSAQLPDPLVEAVRQAPAEWDLTAIDLTDEICESTMCLPTKGQVLIWRDSHHLTATFASLLADKIVKMLPADGLE